MAVQQVQNLPPQFIQDLGKNLAGQITAQTAVPVVSQGIGSLTQQVGEDAAQFKARQDAATQFGIRQDSLAGLAPQVAGQDQLQKDAQARAISGLGSFQPFLTAAQQAGTTAGGMLGTAGTQLTAAGTTLGGIPTGAATSQQIQDFMSPYQSQVIDATLGEFDRNRAIQEQSIRDQQAALGALGSGRAGVQLAEFGTGAARERALLQAGLLQQGFGQAQAARQQDISNQFNIGQAQAAQATQRGQLAQAQQGLGSFQSALGGQTQVLQGGDISRLGQLGALNQAQAQAGLDATREANRMATFQPQEQLDRYAGQVTGLMGGVAGQGTQTTNIPNPTPLQTALGVGTTLAGIYGAVQNPGKINFNMTSDINLKTDIKLKSKSPSGLNIYSFKYKGDDKTYQGVMAQEVPWASSIAENGYLQVDYSKVDVEFKRLN